MSLKILNIFHCFTYKNREENLWYDLNIFRFNKYYKIIFFFLVILLTSCSGYSDSKIIGSSSETQQKINSVKAQTFNYQNYSDVLQKYVNSFGQVDYQKLKDDRQALDKINKKIGEISPSLYQAWSEEEKIAFLINAYNSLTLASIINNYPVKSIRDIPGVWNRQKFKVVGQEVTLDDIEHQNLRKNFNEPRIHMALVCAAVSCPKLRTEAYTGEKLNAQLDQQSREFLSNPSNFRIERESNKVYVSSILKWFGQDFEKSYGRTENFKGLNRKETAFLNFISQYLSPADAKYLTQGGYRVNYLDYDWSLNQISP